MDAIRISDGCKVAIKRVPSWSNEITVVEYLRSAPLASDSGNRTVPILEIIPSHEDPSTLLVMPMLYGAFSELPFRRLGEFAEAMQQFLEVSEILRYRTLWPLKIVMLLGPQIHAR